MQIDEKFGFIVEQYAGSWAKVDNDKFCCNVYLYTYFHTVTLYTVLGCIENISSCNKDEYATQSFNLTFMGISV